MSQASGRRRDRVPSLTIVAVAVVVVLAAGAVVVAPDAVDVAVVAVAAFASTALVAVSLERANRDRERAVEARLAADRARADALAALGRAVARAPSTEAVVAAVAEHARHVVGARGSNVGLIDRAGTALLTVHDADLGALADAYATQSLSASLPLVDATTSGAPVVCATPDEVAHRYPQIADDFLGGGLCALVAVPLTGPGGALGAIGFAWDRPIGDDDEVDRALPSLADICTQALARTALTERREQRALAMAELTESLAAASSVEGAITAFHDHAPNLFGAFVATIDGLGAPVAVMSEPCRTIATALAASSARSTFCADRAALLVAVPDLVAEIDACGVESAAMIPLRDPDTPGRAMCVLWRHPVVFDGGLRGELLSAAVVVAQALARVELIAAEHELAVSLQRRVLRPLPDIPGVELAARYVPAARRVDIGGDWFDAVTHDGKVTLVVGDLVGHGLDAIARMTELRAIVNRLLQAGTALDVVLDALVAMDDPNDPTFATVQLATIDLAARSLTHLSAGHPAAVVAANGDVKLLDGARGPMLGAPHRRVEPAVVPLPDGAIVAMFTDGLVERRRDGLDVGVADVITALEARGASDLEQLADELLDTVDGADRTIDDTVLLLARMVTSPATAEGGVPLDAAVVVEPITDPTSTPTTSVSFTLPATPSAVRTARRLAVEALTGADDAAATTVALLVSELATNAVRHARTPFTVTVTTTGAEERRVARIEVCDESTVPSNVAVAPESLTSPGGRGLRIVEQLARTWGAATDASGTVVWFEIAAPHVAATVL